MHPTRFLFAAIAASSLFAASASAQGGPLRQFATLDLKRHLPQVDRPTVAMVGLDADGDGHRDLLVGHSGSLRLLRNDGVGRFADVTATHLPPTTVDVDVVSLAAGDVDGDGDADIVVGVELGDGLLYRNLGNGRFAAPTVLPGAVGSTVTAIQLVDLDRDADLDLVLGRSSFAGPTDLVLVNDGAGNFTDETAARHPGSAPQPTYALATGDVDGDGDDDLLVAHGFGGVLLYHNDGTGRFVAPSVSLLLPPQTDARALGLADLDRDGDPDLLVGNRLQQNRWLRNHRGRFDDVTPAQMPLDADATAGFGIADFDRDGDLDVFVANTGSQNRLYVNDGRGRLVELASSGVPTALDETSCVVVGDFDRDGDADVVFGNRSGPDRLLRNVGAMQFVDATEAAIPLQSGFVSDVVVADLDGDRHLDVVLGDNGAGGGGQMRYLRGDGTGAFVDESLTRLPFAVSTTAALIAGDVDGDGDLDLIDGNTTLDRLLLNDGRGTFRDATSQLPAIPRSTLHLLLVDIDGDGDLDLIGSTTSGMSVQRNDGQGHFTEVAGLIPATMSGRFRAGDIDRDGDIDLVGGTRFSVLLNDGTGRFVDATATNLPPQQSRAYLDVVLADFDGDSDLDAIGGSVLFDHVLYLNRGDGTFVDASSQIRAPTGVVRQILTADVDLDGDLDVAMHFHTGDNLLRLLRNDGNAVFTDVADAPLGVAPQAIAFGDVDGDGDPDLLTGGFLSSAQLWQNLHRQIATPYLPVPGQTFVIDVYSQPGYAQAFQVAAPIVSGARLAQPVTLPPFGALFVDPTNAIVLPPVGIPGPTGIGRVTLTLPATPVLTGQPFFVQALVATPSPIELALRLTNFTAERVTR